MKKSMCMVVSAATACVVWLNHGWAQQPGPGEQPTLRNPYETAPPVSGLPFPLNQQAAPANRQAAPPANQPDPNQDILVTEREGPWMLCLAWYSGQDAPVWARQMVMELRNHYRLPAYVFNRGAEERRKEDERIRAIKEKQLAFFKQQNLPLTTPIRVKRLQIEEQCAVLIGNYADADAARRGLDAIRRLDPPDPKKVKLFCFYNGETDDKNPEKVNVKDIKYQNPFAKAFVVHNPVLKVERPREWEQSEAAALRKLNQGEDYSLFNCTKPYTLVIKQFSTPSVLQPRSASGTFLAALGLGKTGDGIDTAAHNAHNLADLMRKSFNLEAYVLHTRQSSMVTVGGFEGPGDPHMRSTQEMLTNRLKVPSVLPMAVPR